MTSLLTSGPIVALVAGTLLILLVAKAVSLWSSSRRRRVTSSPTVYRTYPVYNSSPLR
jgi:hypothetical protein